MGLQIQAFNVGNSDEIDAAFATFARERPDALFVSPDPFFTVRSVASSRPWRDRAASRWLIGCSSGTSPTFRQVAKSPI
jgi:hypothetical protein